MAQGKARENYDKEESGKPYRNGRVADSISSHKEAKQNSGWSWWPLVLSLSGVRLGLVPKSAPSTRPGLQNFWIVLCLQIQATSASWG